jgi:DNA-binding response OmpR family regulator
MIGNIEEAIMANYKKALENGNYAQAQQATELAGKLRELIELQGFVDTKKMTDEPRLQTMNVFKPAIYSYDPKSATINIYGQLVNLTNIENKLFLLLTKYPSNLENIEIITKEQIRDFIWPGLNVSKGAVRILITRLRKKIEINPSSPEILINFNHKGYLFLGKQE